MLIENGRPRANYYTAMHKNANATSRHAKQVERRRSDRYIAEMASPKSPEHPAPDHPHRHGEGETHGDLTPGRRRILDVLASAGQPLGAYEMIDLIAARSGKRPAPISIYRALDFLVDHGLVHRLASRNAYLACDHRHRASDPVAFLICDTCGTVSEATSEPMQRSLDAVAEKAGFLPRSRVIEVTGTCATCKAA